MAKYEIAIEGMGCPMCVKKVNAALEELGAKVESCEIGKAVIGFDGDTAAVKEAIEDRGFDVIAIAEK